MSALGNLAMKNGVVLDDTEVAPMALMMLPSRLDFRSNRLLGCFLRAWRLQPVKVGTCTESSCRMKLRESQIMHQQFRSSSQRSLTRTATTNR
jgi:hypothetical protein